MNILKVEFHLQNGLESVDAFQPRMGAFGRFAIVQPLDVSIDMFLSIFSRSRNCCIRVGAGSAVFPRQKGQYPGQARVPP